MIDTDWKWQHKNALKQRRRSERYKLVLYKIRFSQHYDQPNTSIEQEYDDLDQSISLPERVKAFLDFDEVDSPVMSSTLIFTNNSNCLIRLSVFSCSCVCSFHSFTIVRVESLNVMI